MSFHDDIDDTDFRLELELPDHHLGALLPATALPTRTRVVDERPSPNLQRRAMRLVGADRPLIDALRRGGG